MQPQAPGGPGYKGITICFGTRSWGIPSCPSVLHTWWLQGAGSGSLPGCPSLKIYKLQKEEDTDRQTEEDGRLLKITPKR